MEYLIHYQAIVSMEAKEIKALIELINDSNISEFKIKKEDFSLVLRTKHYTETVQQVVASAPTAIVAPAAMPVVPAAPIDAPAAAIPTQSSTVAAVPTTTIVEQAATASLHTFKSPMIGTFYRSPSPDKPPYIKIGDQIEKGSVLCIIEAMKLFNEIESEINGRIVEILVDDTSPVEYDQPLFKIELTN